jgi:phenylpropionate dioxygenase-like ring-hydroxylating dioxygenase large terminal subunit
LQCQYHG